jgi:hypothetical protein
MFMLQCFLGVAARFQGDHLNSRLKGIALKQFFFRGSIFPGICWSLFQIFSLYVFILRPLDPAAVPEGLFVSDAGRCFIQDAKEGHIVSSVSFSF